MPQITKKVRLDKLKYFFTHLSLLNCLFPESKKMTVKEMEILTYFMWLDGDFALNRFGPSAKKEVMIALGLSKSGLSNYLTSLLNKGLLIKRTDAIEILPILLPDNNEQVYIFKLENTNVDEKVLTIIIEE